MLNLHDPCPKETFKTYSWKFQNLTSYITKSWKLLRVPVTEWLTNSQMFLGNSNESGKIPPSLHHLRVGCRYRSIVRRATERNLLLLLFFEQNYWWVCGKNVNESVISGENLGANGANRVKWSMGYDFRTNGLFIAINDTVSLFVIDGDCISAISIQWTEMVRWVHESIL